MSHRNHFKPHKDHPELSALLDAKPESETDPDKIAIAEAIQRAFTADAALRLREMESLNHGG